LGFGHAPKAGWHDELPNPHHAAEAHDRSILACRNAATRAEKAPAEPVMDSGICRGIDHFPIVGVQSVSKVMRYMLIATAVVTVWSGAAPVAQCGGDGPELKVSDMTSIDVLLIGGQSNAEGHGERRGPRVPEGMAFQYFRGVISAGNDPIGTADVGSAWPAFMSTYVTETKRRVAVVPAAVGGTAQSSMCPAAAQNWDTDGDLWGNSVSLLRNALIAFKHDGIEPKFRGVLWSQGEADAGAIAQGCETITEYERALRQMISRYRALDFTGPSMPFYIFRTGALGNAPRSWFPWQRRTDFLDQVREAQERIAASDPLSPIVFREAADFPQRGLMRTGEHILHYTQDGYDLMGRMGAEAVIAAQRQHAGSCR
jgi:hypothetical protein